MKNKIIAGGISLALIFAVLFVGISHIFDTNKTYEVSFVTDGGTPKVETQKVKKGSLVKEPENVSKLGYDLSSWRCDGKKWNFDTDRVYENISLKAKWDIVKYSIRYDLNGGEVNGTNPTQYTVEDSFDLILPTKKGYNSNGWCDQNNKVLNKISKGTTGDLKLKANYEAASQNISTYFTLYTSFDIGTISCPSSACTGERVTLSVQLNSEFVLKDFTTNVNNVDCVKDLTAGTFTFTMPPESLNIGVKVEFKKYSITYIFEEDAVNDSRNPSSYTINDSFSIYPAIRPGYSFEGWYNQHGDLVSYFGLNIYHEDFVLTAHWSLASYTITYLIGENATNDSRNPTTYTMNSSFELYPATRPGYKFLGWYDLNWNLVERITTGQYGNLTLTAEWEVCYTITYDLDGGTNDSRNPSTYNGTFEVTLYPASKDGYYFYCWIDEFDNYLYSIPNGTNRDITLHPYFCKWYSITYVLDGGTNDPYNPTQYHEMSGIGINAPTREGYTFDGWYDQDGNYKDYIPLGDTGDLVLTAHWSPITYSIFYTLDGGTNNPLNPMLYTGLVEITLYPATRDCYRFLGWYDQNGNLVEKISVGQTGILELTAHWEACCTITYVLNGGTNSPSNPETFDGTTEIVLQGATKDGYCFYCWKDENDNFIYTIPAGTKKNITLYAIFYLWYSVTYVLDGGTNDPSNPTQYHELSGIDLCAPTKEGYTFEGWYDQNGECRTRLCLGDTGDLVLTAHWSLND